LVRSSEAAFNAAIIWLYEPMVEACESDANRRLAGILSALDAWLRPCSVRVLD
jgi:hypothetical protein